METDTIIRATVADQSTYLDYNMKTNNVVRKCFQNVIRALTSVT